LILPGTVKPLLTLEVFEVVEVDAELVVLDLLDPQPAISKAVAQASATGLIHCLTVPPHFLTGAELSAGELSALLDRAIELKDAPLSSRALAGRGVALIFEKPSTRTRVSFEMGVHELGGHAVVLRSGETQLSRGESPRDTALVLSRQVAAVGIRTGADAILEELSAHAAIPVFNMLTASHHPCQVLADLMTVRETFGVVRAPNRLRLAYVGDGTNVAHMDIAIASPPAYSLEGDLSLPPGAEGSLSLYHDPYEAVKGASAVYTDVWVSMGDEDTASERRAALAPYRIDDALLDAAAPDAIALHCLPAHPGEEISAEVLYGPRQRIWESRRRHERARASWREARRQWSRPERDATSQTTRARRGDRATNRLACSRWRGCGAAW
jgi:ornithine carbamoyltransferase